MFKITSVLFLAFWQLTAIPIVSAIAQNDSHNIVQTRAFPASEQGVSVAYRS